MTIQQEAYEKIMKLPDDGVRLIIALADEIARQSSFLSCMDAERARKKKAFQDMLDMKKQSAYPKDFDYKKVMEEVLHVNAQYIVTCNIKDFQSAKSHAITPDSCIKMLTDTD